MPRRIASPKCSAGRPRLFGEVAIAELDGLPLSMSLWAPRIPLVDLQVRYYCGSGRSRPATAFHGANDQVRLWVRTAVRQEPPDHDVRAPVHYGDAGSVHVPGDHSVHL